MVDVAAERTRLHVALLAQGYARVAVEKLTPAGAVDITDPAVPPQLDAALRGATNTTQWAAVGQRFALLRQMPGQHFDNLYLRADTRRLRLVVVARFGSRTLQLQDFRVPFQYAWPILKNLDELLEAFQLPDPIRDVGSQLVSGYLTADNPATSAAASLLNAALAAHVVNAGPQCAFIGICETGVTAELSTSVDGWRFFEKKVALAMYPPYMGGFLWDVVHNAVYGHDMRGGGTISPTQLRQSLGAT